MPKYTSKSMLTKEGKNYPHGTTIELTEEQAERLGDKVGPYEEPTAENVDVDTVTEEQFRKMSAKDQSKLVEDKGGDLNVLTNADARWEYFSQA